MDVEERRKEREGEGKRSLHPMRTRPYACRCDDALAISTKQQDEIVQPADPTEAMCRCVHREVKELIIRREDAEPREAVDSHASCDQRLGPQDVTEASIRMEVKLERRRARMDEMQVVPEATMTVFLDAFARYVADLTERLGCARRVRGHHHEVDIGGRTRGRPWVETLREQRALQDDTTHRGGVERAVDPVKHRDVPGVIALPSCITKLLMARDRERQLGAGSAPGIQQDARDAVPVRVLEERRSVLDAVYAR